jgi:hypothetical protein
MVATDGVYFTSPHPDLRLSNSLGDWSVEEHSRLCQFMPGLYWDDKTRQGLGNIKSRGINADDLAACVRELDNKWIWKIMDLTNPDHPYKDLTKLIGRERVEYLRRLWPRIDVPLSFPLISARLAIHRRKWRSCGMVETDSVTQKPKYRVLSGDPSDKRDTAQVTVDSRGIIWSMPYDVAPSGGMTSTPYEKRFGLELRDRIIEDDLISPDGRIDDEIYWRFTE